MGLRKTVASSGFQGGRSQWAAPTGSCQPQGRLRTDSTARNTGSGRITIPPPPP